MPTVILRKKISINHCNGSATYVFEASVKQGEARAVTTRSNTNIQDDSRTVLLYAGLFLGLADCPSWAVPYQSDVSNKRSMWIRSAKRSISD